MVKTKADLYDKDPQISDNVLKLLNTMRQQTTTVSSGQ